MISAAPASSISSSQRISLVDATVGVSGAELGMVWVDVLVIGGLGGWQDELYTFTV